MQLVLDFPVVPRYSFDNFVVCGGNRTAFEFARRLTDPAAGESVLYVYGPPGSGKTHLLMAIGREMHCDVDEASYLSCGALTAVPAPGSAEVISPFVERLQDSPVLLIDDIDLLPDSRPRREDVWHLFNEFYQSGRKIVVTGAVPPRELVSVDDHLISRLLWALVARIDVSDDDSRSLILKKLADDQQIMLPDDVIAFLLTHTRRDVPSLIDAFAMLVRQALVSGKKISVRLAREALGSGDAADSR
jgi:chromosomal replication initiator protein